jgi:hypothetical protein
MTETNQIYIPKEIKSKMNSKNDYYHSVQNLLPTHLSQNINIIKIYKTMPMWIFWVVTQKKKPPAAALRGSFKN